MRQRLGIIGIVTGSFIGLFGLAVMAAENPPDDYSKAMKDINAAVARIDKAMAAGDFDTIGKSAGTIVDTLPVVEKYWTGKAEDGVMFAQAAAKVAGDLRAVAGLQSTDGVAFSAKELAAVCTQCHMAHREALPNGTFQIK